MQPELVIVVLAASSVGEHVISLDQPPGLLRSPRGIVLVTVRMKLFEQGTEGALNLRKSSPVLYL